MKRIIAILALIVFGTLSMSAMDPIRVAGMSSTTSIKDVTLTLTVNIYDASNTQIWTSDFAGVYFDNQGVFSFILDASALTYNPVYNVKILNASGGTILFESRLDKIVLAQSQIGAELDPAEVNPNETFYFYGVEVTNGMTRAGIQRSSGGEPTLMADDVFYAYDDMGNKTFGVSAEGDGFLASDLILGNDLRVDGTSDLHILDVTGQLTAESSLISEGTTDLQGQTTANAVTINGELVAKIQAYTSGASVIPTAPVLSIGTLVNDVTLADGYAGQIIYVVGNTSTWTLSGSAFTRGATFVCTAPDVWVCVGKN